MVSVVESHQGGKEVVGTNALHSSYKGMMLYAHTTSFTKILALVSHRVPSRKVIFAKLGYSHHCKYVPNLRRKC